MMAAMPFLQLDFIQCMEKLLRLFNRETEGPAARPSSQSQPSGVCSCGVRA